MLQSFAVIGRDALKERNITGKIEDLPYYRTGGLQRSVN